MSEQAKLPTVAVDIGNSRIKLAWFEHDALNELAPHALPMPRATMDMPSRDWAEEPLVDWLEAHSATPTRWLIGSVFRAATARLQAWIAAARASDDVHVLRGADIPLKLDVEFPDRVGIDRLLAAAGANRLRDPSRAAIVVDLGSAITVDLVSADGVFRGGAILPGIGMSARALGEQTDVLPHLPLTELDDPPSPLGRSTQTAIEAGLFWGAVGAVRELAARQAALRGQEHELFVTGGAAPSVAALLCPTARYEPFLVLASALLCEAAPRTIV